MKTLVWLKRDLRSTDHQPLLLASAQTQAVALYIYEPEWFSSWEFESIHLQFVNESLDELELKLASKNISLIRKYGSAVDVLKDLRTEFPFESLLSHQETGVDWTFTRDRKVAQWCKSQGIQWQEFESFGVVRRLKNRDHWNQHRSRIVEREIFPTLKTMQNKIRLPSCSKRTPLDFNLPVLERTKVQKGGESEATKILESFLSFRASLYMSSISKPRESQDYGSRLSPYITWGCVSLTQIHNALVQQRRWLQDSDHRKGLWAFENRLWWHCHFIQKLESEPAIEFNNVNRAFDGMREENFNDDLFNSWCKGQTGYPMVDACMRSLQKTGWLNFRMRAMLISFSSYHLWLHWRKPAEFLARHFLDFEPGIHFSQVQMQSGVTGINAIRIYSPLKQAQDNDPDGLFIREHCPELSHLPTEYLHDPSSIPPLLQQHYGCVLGRDYPYPIVDHSTAYAAAKNKIFSWRQKPEVRKLAQAVLEKHGSRNNGMGSKRFPRQKRS
jgi:deoxyribodipyrimidine photo-lyase